MKLRILTILALTMLALLALTSCNAPQQLVDAGSHVKLKIRAIESKSVERALEMFRFDVGRYPTTEEGLNSLIHHPGLPGWQRPYLQNPVTIQGLEYKSDGRAFSLRPKHG